ncbi:hypothetical protein Terro_3049 [Terriglobus roseus DSM 18391]|uniref:DUF1772 domain-containing protein n=1 Tax=Terriglobus roseus (strain DSM 18391 / NRRL B-41598 / KBS 63) TaxID=926566 RepID=I3ZJ63_TERRK|nr:hypothetical protein [Terriglobus roseus]AFL89281.1 hypothetical protein Terro_3049 [Terriglobus roseus DSM 18391]
MLDFRRLYSTFYLVLSIGVTWAALSQDRVNYPSWALVGPAEFNAFHHAVIVGTYTYIIPFALLSLPAGIAMIWLRHPAISRSLVILVLAVGLFGGAITTRLAIPIQKQMDYGDHRHIPALVQQLITIDLYWRVIPGLIALAALATMTYQLSGTAKTVSAK